MDFDWFGYVDIALLLRIGRIVTDRIFLRFGFFMSDLRLRFHFEASVELQLRSRFLHDILFLFDGGCAGNYMGGFIGRQFTAICCLGGDVTVWGCWEFGEFGFVGGLMAMRGSLGAVLEAEEVRSRTNTIEKMEILNEILLSLVGIDDRFYYVQ
jgi:hypothetical protein